ncbi:hypothetical protein ABTF54_20665, partial [Acinetobacter baumannii]
LGAAASSGIFFCDINNTIYQYGTLSDFLANQESMDRFIKRVAISMVRIWESQIHKIAEGDAANVKYFANCAVARMV